VCLALVVVGLFVVWQCIAWRLAVIDRLQVDIVIILRNVSCKVFVLGSLVCLLSVSMYVVAAWLPGVLAVIRQR